MKITEKELKEMGFEDEEIPQNWLILTICETEEMDIFIIYDKRGKNFTLMISGGVVESESGDLKINSLQDLKEVIKHSKKLSEFMV